MKKILCMVAVTVMLLTATGATYGKTEPAIKKDQTMTLTFGNAQSIELAAGSSVSSKLKDFISKFYKQIQQTKPATSQPSMSGSGESESAGQIINLNMFGNTKTSQVVSLVNQERSKAGLAALKSNSRLTELAQLKAEDMAKNAYFSHTSPTYGSAFDMMKKYGVPYKTAGENIAKGQKTPDAVMTGWMNSQGHRANIFSDTFTSIGVGCAADKNGTTYWVQMFKG